MQCYVHFLPIRAKIHTSCDNSPFPTIATRSEVILKQFQYNYRAQRFYFDSYKALNRTPSSRRSEDGTVKASPAMKCHRKTRGGRREGGKTCGAMVSRTVSQSQGHYGKHLLLTMCGYIYLLFFNNNISPVPSLSFSLPHNVSADIITRELCVQITVIVVNN